MNFSMRLNTTLRVANMSDQQLIDIYRENIKKEDLNSAYMKFLLRHLGYLSDHESEYDLNEATQQVFEIIDQEDEKYEDWDNCKKFLEKNFTKIYDITYDQFENGGFDQDEIDEILFGDFQ